MDDAVDAAGGHFLQGFLLASGLSTKRSGKRQRQDIRQTPEGNLQPERY